MKRARNDEPNESCPICLEELDDVEFVCKLECKHAFHDMCLLEWQLTNSTCPVCRAVVKCVSHGAYHRPEALLHQIDTLKKEVLSLKRTIQENEDSDLAVMVQQQQMQDYEDAYLMLNLHRVGRFARM